MEIILNQGGFSEPKMRRSDRVKKGGTQNLEHNRIEHLSLSHAHTGIEHPADSTGVELAGIEHQDIDQTGIEYHRFDQAGTKYQNLELAGIEYQIHAPTVSEYQI